MGMSKVTTVLSSVKRIDDPRSIIRPQTRYATIMVADETALIAPMIVAGCGYSLAIPANGTAVMSSVAVSEIGKASGTFTMLRQLGGAFGVAILAAVFAGVGSFASPQAFTNGFVPAISVAAALALVGAIAGLALPGRRRATRATRATEVAPAQPAPAAAGAGGS